MQYYDALVSNSLLSQACNLAVLWQVCGQARGYRAPHAGAKRCSVPGGVPNTINIGKLRTQRWRSIAWHYVVKFDIINTMIFMYLLLSCCCYYHVIMLIVVILLSCFNIVTSWRIIMTSKHMGQLKLANIAFLLGQSCTKSDRSWWHAPRTRCIVNRPGLERWH